MGTAQQKEVAMEFGHTQGIILPQELSNQIIEGLQTDRRSLKYCSLVCRSWLFSSRIHLFQKLVFTSENVARISTLITKTPSRYSTIPPYVKEIEFRYIQIPLVLEPRLLSHFSSTLTKLHFHDIAFNTFHGLLDVICAFSCLQSLGLNNVKWANPSEADQIAIQKRVLPLSVIHLRLYQIHFRNFVGWLLAHPTLPTVPRLEIGPLDEEQIPCTGYYMCLIGSGLKHLAISFGFGEIGHVCVHDILQKGDQNQPMPDRPSITSVAYHYKRVFGITTCDHLSFLTNLRTLRIDGFLDFSAVHQSTALFWAPRLFASIKSYNLNKIVLGLKLSRAGELDSYNVNWEFLDQALTGDIYANLHSVEFEVEGRVNIDGVASLVALRLPIIASRGLLRFSRSA